VPKRVKDLNIFVIEMARLIELTSRCREVLFRESFRNNLPEAAREAISRLEQLAETRKELRNPANYKDMVEAGLTGPQLELKLECFESALVAFQTEGGEDRLGQSLDAGGTILSSLAGAIPGFGSFAQELVDFFLKELKKRWRFWRR
jgi:hypothetical protein